jgi:hypothetical protein
MACGSPTSLKAEGRNETFMFRGFKEKVSSGNNHQFTFRHNLALKTIIKSGQKFFSMTEQFSTLSHINTRISFSLWSTLTLLNNFDFAT